MEDSEGNTEDGGSGDSKLWILTGPRRLQGSEEGLYRFLRDVYVGGAGEAIRALRKPLIGVCDLAGVSGGTFRKKAPRFGCRGF